MSEEYESVCHMGADGRVTIPEEIRVLMGVNDQEAMLSLSIELERELD